MDKSTEAAATAQVLELDSEATDEDLIELVEPTRRQAFLQFINTGEADEDFLNHLNQDKDCQRAVELAFTRQAAGFEDLAQALKETPGEKGTLPIVVPATAPPSHVPNQIATAVELAMQANPAERERLVAKQTAEIAAATPLEQLGLVVNVLKSMGNHLDKLKSA